MSPRQKAFVPAYLVSLNATAAALEVGYSPRSAASIGQRLLKTPSIRRLIDEAAAKRTEAAGVEEEAVLRKLATVLSATVDDFDLRDGRVHVRPGVPREALGAVRSFSFRREYDFEGKLRLETGSLSLWDVPKSLSLAMRRLGLLKDKVEISAANTVHVYLPSNGRERQAPEASEKTH